MLLFYNTHCFSVPNWGAFPSMHKMSMWPQLKFQVVAAEWLRWWTRNELKIGVSTHRFKSCWQRSTHFSYYWKIPSFITTYLLFGNCLSVCYTAEQREQRFGIRQNDLLTQSRCTMHAQRLWITTLPTYISNPKTKSHISLPTRPSAVSAIPEKRKKKIGYGLS